MDKTSLKNKLFELLPLDDESLMQTIDYALTLDSNDIANHFISLIGESPLLFEFIQDLNKYKDKKLEIKYVKPEIQKAKKKVTLPEKKPIKNAWTAAKPSDVKSSSKARLVNTKSSHTVSELVEQTPLAKAKETKKVKSKAQKLSDINELDTILRNLEYGSANSNVTCNCMAVEHGLNKAVPNCLNCGKIVCRKESGRTTCSFCNEPLISLNEKLEMVRLIQQEKQKLMESGKPVNTGEKKKKKEKITISMGAGSKSFFKQQDKLFASLEKKEQSTVDVDRLDQDKAKAESTLNTLLGYQDNSTQRTKIIDQVSDYSLPDETNIWTKSSLDKILELKKQQRNLKKKEKSEAERTGRGQKFIELNVKGGKVTIKEKGTRAPQVEEFEYSDEEDDFLDSEDEQIKKEIKEIKEQIKIEESSKQKELAKKKWDFSQDQKKWLDRKPKYVSKNTLKVDDEKEEEQKFDRVQLEANLNTPLEELLVGI